MCILRCMACAWHACAQVRAYRVVNGDDLVSQLPSASSVLLGASRGQLQHVGHMVQLQWLHTGGSDPRAHSLRSVHHSSRWRIVCAV